MSHIAFHLDAQRQQRVIDKKHAALARLALKQVRLSRRQHHVQQS